MFRVCFLLFAGSIFWIACNSEDQQPVAAPAPEETTMDSLTVQIRRARDYQDNQQYQKALLTVDSILQRFPGQLDALGIKAEILQEQGKPQEALALLEKAYALQPRDKETAYNLAYAYAEAKNARVLPLTDTLIRFDKTATVARAWYIKAVYYHHTGNDKEALRLYDSATLADYNFLDAYIERGKLLLNQKKYDAALKSFAIGQKISPATPEFYFWVAKTQEAMGHKADAKMNYERAYALDKTWTEAKQAADRL